MFYVPLNASGSKTRRGKRDGTSALEPAKKVVLKSPQLPQITLERANRILFYVRHTTTGRRLEILSLIERNPERDHDSGGRQPASTEPFASEQAATRHYDVINIALTRNRNKAKTCRESFIASTLGQHGHYRNLEMLHGSMILEACYPDCEIGGSTIHLPRPFECNTSLPPSCLKKCR